MPYFKSASLTGNNFNMNSPVTNFEHLLLLLNKVSWWFVCNNMNEHWNLGFWTMYRFLLIWPSVRKQGLFKVLWTKLMQMLDSETLQIWLVVVEDVFGQNGITDYAQFSHVWSHMCLMYVLNFDGLICILWKASQKGFLSFFSLIVRIVCITANSLWRVKFVLSKSLLQLPHTYSINIHMIS